MQETGLPAMKFLNDTTADSKGMPLVLLPGTACDERLFLPLVERLDHDGPTLTGGLRGARSMSISTVAPNGRPFADTYALSGAATAIDAAALGCAGR